MRRWRESLGLLAAATVGVPVGVTALVNLEVTLWPWVARGGREGERSHATRHDTPRGARAVVVVAREDVAYGARPRARGGARR